MRRHCKALKQFWRYFLNRNNDEVNTGAVIAVFACVLAMVVIAWNEWLGFDVGPNNRDLLLALIALGGWGYHISVRGE